MKDWDPLALILLLASVLILVGLMGVLVWQHYDLKKHCTKWGTQKVQQQICVFNTGKVCTMYETRTIDEDVCLERDN